MFQKKNGTYSIAIYINISIFAGIACCKHTLRTDYTFRCSFSCNPQLQYFFHKLLDKLIEKKQCHNTKLSYYCLLFADFSQLRWSPVFATVSWYLHSRQLSALHQTASLINSPRRRSPTLSIALYVIHTRAIHKFICVCAWYMSIWKLQLVR